MQVDGNLDQSTRPYPDPGDATISLLFSDIEGSTILQDRLGDTYSDVLARHQYLLRSVLDGNGGHEVDAHADSFFAVFDTARGAVTAAVSAQQTLEKESWPKAYRVRVRMGIHTGHARLFQGTYVGLDVHRAARICAAGHGGQVLISGATWSEVGQRGLPKGIYVRDLGSHRLKGLRYPESIFELRIPGLPEQFAPIQSLDNHPNNLPAPDATATIGREEQINELSSLLSREDIRVVTLTGPGGTGKTRLSVEVARRLVGVFQDGVYQVLLEHVRDPSLVATHIAQSLGIHELPEHSAIESLSQTLGTGRVLLLLDNFEQVVDAAHLVTTLVNNCPRLKILVTSRDLLNIPSQEHPYRLKPLEIPSQKSIEAVEKCDAVRLLVERVRTFQPNFGVTENNASAVAEICKRLDGLPLAIELAASHLRVLSPQALLERLSHRLDMLRGSSRDKDERQRTMRGTIAWSYNLLNADEQSLFERVSVFSRGFDVAAVEAVCSVESDPQTTDLLETLSSLTTKSLVVGTLVNGEPRLNMLETIRDFGLERLGEKAAELRKQHALYYTKLAEKLAPDLLTRGQRHSLTRLLDEGENIRAALSYGLQQHDANITSRLVSALLWLWIGQGQFIEAKYWIDQALGQVEQLEDTREKALVLDTAGWLSMLSGNYAGAFPDCEKASRIFRSPLDVARAKLAAGLTGALTGQCSDGPKWISEALEEYRRHGDRYGTALTLIALGGVNLPTDGDASEERVGEALIFAEKCFSEALDLMEKLGNAYWPSAIRQNLALYIHLPKGDWQGAAQLLGQMVEPAQEYNYPLILNQYLAAMGAVAISRKQPAVAAQLFGAVSHFLRDLGATFELPDRMVFDANKTRVLTEMKLLYGDERGEAAYLASIEEGGHWTEAQAIAAAKALCSD